MSNDGMNRAQQLFLEALEQPEDNRDVWLTEQCVVNIPALCNMLVPLPE